MIYFNNIPFYRQNLIKKLFKMTLLFTGNRTDKISVGVKCVNEEEIQNLNKQHRSVDKVTDVLSFPMLDITEGQKLSEFDSERNPMGELYIGDIVICKERIKQQAKQFNHSYKRELAFLVVHGFLHLLGYDHIQKEEEERMMNLAENILLNFRLERKDV